MFSLWLLLNCIYIGHLLLPAHRWFTHTHSSLVQMAAIEEYCSHYLTKRECWREHQWPHLPDAPSYPPQHSQWDHPVLSISQTTTVMMVVLEPGYCCLMRDSTNDLYFCQNLLWVLPRFLRAKQQSKLLYTIPFLPIFCHQCDTCIAVLRVFLSPFVLSALYPLQVYSHNSLTHHIPLWCLFLRWPELTELVTMSGQQKHTVGLNN